MNSVVSVQDRLTSRMSLVRCLVWSAIAVTGLASAHAQLRLNYTKVATLGISPSVSNFVVGQFNTRLDFSFSSDTDLCLEITNGVSLCEGVFASREARTSQVVAAGDPAPGLGDFAGIVLGPTAMNAYGDVAMALVLEPLTTPLGLNSGIYRYSSAAHTITGMVIPGITPLPGSARVKFLGVSEGVSINANSTIAFAGIVPTTAGLSNSTAGIGIYRVERSGRTTKVMAPGDPAPGGARFNFGARPSINDLNDVAFEAHLAGSEVIGGSNAPTVLEVEATGVYLMKARATRATKVAQQGDLDPAGAKLRHAFAPALNNAGQVLFVGDLTAAPDFNQSLGLYRLSGQTVTTVARPGDTMPGGGIMKTIDNVGAARAQNQRGSICFSAELENGDHGLYLLLPGRPLQLLLKTGSDIPGIGTFASLQDGSGGPAINDVDQVMFAANLTGGATVLLISSRPPAVSSPLRGTRTGGLSAGQR